MENLTGLSQDQIRGLVVQKLVGKQIIQTEKQEAYIDAMLAKMPDPVKAQLEGKDKWEQAAIFWDAYHASVGNEGGNGGDGGLKIQGENNIVKKVKKTKTKGPSKQFEATSEIPDVAQEMLNSFVNEAAYEQQATNARETNIEQVIYMKPTAEELDKKGLMPKEVFPTVNTKNLEKWEKALDRNDEKNVAKFNAYKALVTAEEKVAVAPKYSNSFGAPIGVKITTPGSVEGKKKTGDRTLNKDLLIDFLAAEVPLMIPKNKNGLGVELKVMFVDKASDVAGEIKQVPQLRLKFSKEIGAARRDMEANAGLVIIAKDTYIDPETKEIATKEGNITLADAYSFVILKDNEDDPENPIKQTIHPKGRGKVPELTIADATLAKVFKDAVKDEMKLPTDKDEIKVLVGKQKEIVKGMYGGDFGTVNSVGSKLNDLFSKVNEKLATEGAKDVDGVEA